MRSSRIGAILFCFALGVPVQAQSAGDVQQYNDLVRQYNAIRASLTPAERATIEGRFAEFRSSLRRDATREKVGVITANPYLPGGSSALISRFDPQSPANPYGEYGSPYSVNGARNKYTTGGLDVVGADGQYLGKLNANKYDPNSVSNPYGQYGSRYSPTSINNPYSQYGSPYSSQSARNPYATSPPSLYAPKPITPPAPIWP